MKKTILLIIVLIYTSQGWAQTDFLRRTHLAVGNNQTDNTGVDLMLGYELFITAVNEHYNESSQKYVWTVKVFNNESYHVKVHISVSDYHDDILTENGIEPKGNYQADCIPSKSIKEFSLFFTNSSKRINVWVKNPEKCEE